jgi:hypothetical protein
MNTFPDEVLYNILTYLPLGHMLLVDNHINSLHNELYYKEMLENEYPNLKLKPFSTWKDLCLRSRKEGVVHSRHLEELSSLFVKGIKCYDVLPLKGIIFNNVLPFSSFDNAREVRLLLRFNGDLILINEQGMSEIVDIQVSDISPSGYIKGNHFYGLFVTSRYILTRHLLVESKQPFMFISGDTYGYMCAATQTKLYRYYSSHYCPKIISKSFDFNIRAIETDCVGAIFVLLENGNLVLVDPELSEINTIPDVLNINLRLIQTKQQYILLKFSLQRIDEFRENINTKDFLDESIKFSLDSFDQVRSCGRINEDYVILDKQGLFLIKKGSIIKLENRHKLKRICGSWRQYWICD